jgi:hypothetical protein
MLDSPAQFCTFKNICNAHKWGLKIYVQPFILKRLSKLDLVLNYCCHFLLLIKDRVNYTFLKFFKQNIVVRSSWSIGQCARRAIAEAKHRSMASLMMGDQNYYLELLRLHLQSLVPTPVSRRVDVRQAAGKNNCRIFTTR